MASRGVPRDEADTGEWAKDAAFYIDAFVGIKNIALVDETFHIRQIVPLQDNLPYMNQRASEVNGDPSDINLWVPIHNGKEFNGFILGTIAIDAFISPVLSEINNDYMLQLSDEETTIFESENWSPPQEGFVIRKIITFENTTVLNLTFAPTPELLDSGIANAHKTLIFSLLFSFITIIAVHFAQNFSATAAISTSRYRNLFEASQDAIFIINMKGEYQDANLATTKMFGYSLTELQQMAAVNLRLESEIPPPDVRSHMWTEGGTQEISLRHKDGHTIPVELVTSPIREGVVQKYVLGITRDITERKQAEEALRVSEEKYRSAIQSQRDLIYHYLPDSNGTITLVNDAYCQFYGKPSGEIVGTSHFDKIPSEEQETVREHITRLSAENPTATNVAKNMNSRGEFRWFEWLDQAIFDNSGEIAEYQAIGRDITERVRAEEEKLQMEAHLRQQQKLESIGTLASGVAHEINNPIMGIMNYAQLIYDRLDPAESRLREFSAGIIEETERVAEIVRNLLTFSRQEKQTHSPARMTDIVNHTLPLIRMVIKRDQITLQVDVPDDLPEIKCRSQQIQQVLMNLLTNARDALNQRYPEYDPDKVVTLTVRPFEKEGRRWLRTTVEDHGAGIPAEIRERIFDPFYTTKDRAIGTGLGLSISLGIVQDHHGELTFESVENQLTRFYLDLPLDNGWDL
ncbi:MAG: PAS domain S-box protein [Anaerolineaceae bacterium]|nr:PAS domain S-box protein [Anaerolineaceae bacterium]